jgi:hypothetical protein
VSSLSDLDAVLRKRLRLQMTMLSPRMKKPWTKPRNLAALAALPSVVRATDVSYHLFYCTHLIERWEPPLDPRHADSERDHNLSPVEVDSIIGSSIPPSVDMHDASTKQDRVSTKRMCSLKELLVQLLFGIDFHR